MVAMLRLLAVAASGGCVCSGTGVPSVEIAPGVDMPAIAFGSAKASFKGQCTVTDAVAQWLHLGGRHIDTAYNYGTQPDVGTALEKSGVPRSEVFITTKIPGPIGFAEVQNLVVNTSLREMKVDYIDLLLIHRPCKDTTMFPDKCGEVDKEDRIATWKGLLELKRMGKIRAAGVSNFNVGQLGDLIDGTGEGPAVNQVEWHLGYHNETLQNYMRASDVVLEAWAPLAGPTAVIDGHPGVSLSEPRLQSIADRFNVSTAQVALRWHWHRGSVPVTATCNAAHAAANLQIFDFELTQDDVSLLDSLSAGQAGPAPLLVI